jgi:hypothetical protein
MVSIKIYRKYCYCTVVSILLGCLLFSCKTKDKEQEEREKNSYAWVGFMVSRSKMHHADVINEITLLAERIDKNPAIEVDTRKLDSLVDSNIFGDEYHKRFVDSLAALEKDERPDYFDRARIVFAAINSFYNNDIPVLRNILLSNSTDRAERLFESLGLEKINKAFFEWKKSTSALAAKYPMSEPIRGNVEQ